MKITLTLIAAALLALSPALSQTDPKPAGHGSETRAEFDGERTAHVLLRLADKLILTDSQRKDIQAVIDQGEQELKPLRTQLQTARQAFVAAHDPATFDETAVREEAKLEAPMIEEIAVSEARTRAGALAVLSSQQRDQFKQLVTQHASKSSK